MTAAKADCAATIKHLMKDPRSIKALETAQAYGRGEATDDELAAAAAAADAAAAAADAATKVAAEAAADAAAVAAAAAAATAADDAVKADRAKDAAAVAAEAAAAADKAAAADAANAAAAAAAADAVYTTAAADAAVVAAAVTAADAAKVAAAAAAADTTDSALAAAAETAAQAAIDAAALTAANIAVAAKVEEVNENSKTNIAYENKRLKMSGTITTGFMVSGFETGVTHQLGSDSYNKVDFPTTGTASFKGKGAGYYTTGAGQLDAALQLTEFNVDVEADFAAATVSIETKDTMGYVCEFLETRCDSTSATKTALTNLNFNTGNIDISNTGNNITHKFMGTTAVDGMSGDVNARFYGPATEEFGGTFNLSGNNKSYMGYFGAAKQ
ncbi:MAG: transferrin-binding protein-like solute binding protein [Alphaproteobacteria bacterium]|nr:transferrin-binding protein-like solute binding protein [Alphaproteobacteria bacterium]